MSRAAFTINGSPSADGIGDRLYVAAPSEVLVCTLEQNPSTVLSVRYDLHDPANPESPFASYTAPDLTWSQNAAASYQPAAVNGSANVTMPATVHSYVIRCTVSTPDGPEVFERLVAVATASTTPALRKTVPGESTEARARGISDDLNQLVDAIETIAATPASGGGGLVDLHDPADADIVACWQLNDPADPFVDSGTGAIDMASITGSHSFAPSSLGGGEVALVSEGTFAAGTAAVAAVQLTGALTFAGLFYTHVHSGSPFYIGPYVGSELEADNILLRISITATGIGIGHEYGAGSNEFYTAPFRMPLNRWCHFAITRSADGLTYKVFLDGYVVYTVTAANAPTGGTNAIARTGRDSSGGDFDGQRASIVLYDVEKSEAQVLALAQRCLGAAA